MAGNDSMLEPAKKLMMGEVGSVTGFSNVADPANDFISAIENDDSSLWDMVDERLSGTLPTEPEAEVITIRFTDAPTKLGKSRKTLLAGTGILFPRLMTAT